MSAGVNKFKDSSVAEKVRIVIDVSYMVFLSQAFPNNSICIYIIFYVALTNSFSGTMTSYLKREMLHQEVTMGNNGVGRK
jgi:hypothetical protein